MADVNAYTRRHRLHFFAFPCDVMCEKAADINLLTVIHLPSFALQEETLLQSCFEAYDDENCQRVYLIL